MTTAYTEEDETTTSQDKTNKNPSEMVEKNPATEDRQSNAQENHEELKIIESNCIEEERNPTQVENEQNDEVEETRREEFSEQQRMDSRPKKYIEEMNHVHAEKPLINREECKTIVEIVNVENLCATFQECSFECGGKTNESQDDNDDYNDDDEFEEEEKRRNNNQIVSVRKLIDNCESYSNGVEENYNPEESLNFHEAVRAGDAKIVAMLIKNGEVANLDEPDWNVSGDPPLLVAATNHCLPVLSTLLSNGCDPAVRSPRGETALHRAILNGGPGSVLKFVGELLKYGCPPGVKEAGGGLTALHVLTRQLAHAQSSKSLHHDFEAALKTLDLLAKAGPVNAKDHHGRGALHILASSTTFDNNHRTEIESLIATLLEAGADPALRNDRGETPLHECLECGALNTAILLIPHTPAGITSRYGETPLHIAARKNHTEMVAKLLEHGEDPGLQDAGGNTPLHLASARGFHQIVSLLVTSPLAQLEKINADGLTALQVAAESGFVNAVKLLLQAGADPSHTEHYSPSTLHRHPDILTLIDHELTRRRQLAA